MNNKDLIAKLEAAPEGSWELDEEIARSVGYSLVAGYWHKQDEPPLPTECPPEFSTSLDAKVPGENIIEIRRYADGSWKAWHQDLRTLRPFPGTGRTEALARRIAGLRGMGAK